MWLDILPEEFCNKIKLVIPDCEPESIFLPFCISQFPTPIEMIQPSLSIRNSIPAVIDVNDKKQIEKHAAKIKDLENNRRLFMEGIQNEKKLSAFGLTVYLNDSSQFKSLRFN